MTLQHGFGVTDGSRPNKNMDICDKINLNHMIETYLLTVTVYENPTYS